LVQRPSTLGESVAAETGPASRLRSVLGLHLDPQANETARPDVDVARGSSTARLLVVHTREDLTIVRETVKVVGRGP